MQRNLHVPPQHGFPIGRFFPAAGKVRAAVEPGGATGLNRPKILIAEDNLLLALEMEEALVDAGFDVVGKAVSADQVVAFAKLLSPALVIMDIGLEGARDGIDAAVEILKTCGIGAIFASSYSARDFRDRANAARPLGWLVKPYDMEDLVSLVRESLKPLNS